MADVSFNANMEIDPTYFSSRDRAENGLKESSTSNLGGRVEINAVAELAKNGDNFVNAKASLIVPVSGDSKVSVDDAWIHLGNSTVDVKLGRQEAADLFPLGKDTVVAGANGDIGGYRANTLRGRVDTSRIHTVIGFNAAPGMRAEIGVLPEVDNSDNSNDPVVYGVRPTIVYTTGAATIRLGMENMKAQGADAAQGYGVSFGYALNSSSNINVSYADSSDLDASSVGVNLTMGGFGIGYVQDKTVDDKQDTVYAAYTMPLLGVKGATITPAFSHSKADGVDDLTAVRVRLNYAF
jgi:hypothetical protein